jgi:hypothetical protein
MTWAEFLGWLKTRKRQVEGEETSPDSWRNVDQDPWWQEQRRRRDEERRQR